jgi:hypothetical protein
MPLFACWCQQCIFAGRSGGSQLVSLGSRYYLFPPQQHRDSFLSIMVHMRTGDYSRAAPGTAVAQPLSNFVEVESFCKSCCYSRVGCGTKYSVYQPPVPSITEILAAAAASDCPSSTCSQQTSPRPQRDKRVCSFSRPLFPMSATDVTLGLPHYQKISGRMAEEAQHKLCD